MCQFPSERLRLERLHVGEEENTRKRQEEGEEEKERKIINNYRVWKKCKQ